WPAQGAANIRRAGDRGMPGDQTLKVSAEQRIEIYIRKLQRHLRWIIAAHLHCAIQIEVGILEGGATSHHHLRAPCLDHGIHCAQGFAIQSEVGDVESSVDGRSSRAVAGTAEMKPRFAIQSQAVRLEAAKARQVDSSSRQVEAEVPAADVISKIACQLGSVVRKDEVVELHFPPHQLKLAVKPLERLAIDRELRNLQISTAAQIACGARGAHVDAGHTGNRVMQAGQHLNVLDRDVAEGQLERERTGGFIEPGLNQTERTPDPDL